MKEFFNDMINVLENRKNRFYEEDEKWFLLQFSFLKLLDGALKFSKTDILDEFISCQGSLPFDNYIEFNLHQIYDDSEQMIYFSNFHEKAIYPSGEKLGFFNLSDNDLDSIVTNKENIFDGFDDCNWKIECSNNDDSDDLDEKEKLKEVNKYYLDKLEDYICEFDPIVTYFFHEFSFRETISLLSKKNLLSEIIEDIVNIEIDEEIYGSSDNLEKAATELIYEYLKHYSPSNTKKLKEKYELIIKIMFNGIDFDNVENINLFYPYQNLYLLILAHDYIKKNNSNCTIRFFGNESEPIFRFLNIIRNDFYSENYFSTERFEFGYSCRKLLIYDSNMDYKIDDATLNLIFSDIWYSNYDKFLNYKNNTKVVMLTSSRDVDYILNKLRPLIKDDKVDSIISLPVYRDNILNFSDKSYFNSFLVTMSNFKVDGMKNKILFSDYAGNSNELSDKFDVMNNKISQFLLDLENSTYCDNHIAYSNSYLIDNEKFERFSLSFNFLTYDINMPRFEDILYKKRTFSNLSGFNEPREKIFKEVSIYSLGELVEFDADDYENSIFIFKNKNLPIKIFNKVPNDKRGYIHFKIKNEQLISKEYLYCYLISNRGTSEIKYFTRGKSSRYAKDLNWIKVPVPTLSQQKDIINAVHIVNNFFEDLNFLKDQYQNNILDYQDILEDINELKGNIEISEEGIATMNKSIGHAYESLLWPIAITFLFATNGEYEKTLKAKNYLRLFEFVTIFNSIILLSAIPKEIYNAIKYNHIWRGNWNTYKNMYFGVWYNIYWRLHNSYKFNEFTTSLNKDLFLKISSKDLLDLMRDAKKYRNENSHDALSNHYEVEEILDELNSKLLELKNYLSPYSEFKLFYFEKHKEAYDDTQDIYYVMSLNGPYAQPIYHELITNKRLKRNSLYLYHPKTNDILLIDDNLMKFIRNEHNQWRLYVFIGFKEDNNQNQFAVYKCFQQNIDNYEVPINSFKEDIIN